MSPSEIPSIQELRKLCQKPNYKTVGNWMVRNILRDAAVPCTWLFLHTPLSANHVTLIAIAVGVIGNFFVALPSAASLAFGAILLQLWYYLDHVDGQIARFKNETSLTGRFLDYLMHHVIHSTLFFAFGLHFYLTTSETFYLFAGFLSSAAITLFNMIHDIKSKTFIEAILSRSASIRKFAQETDAPDSQTKPSFLRKVYSLVHKTCEIHVVMNMLTVLAFAQTISPRFSFLTHFVMLYYVVISIPLVVVKLTYVITAKQIDSEFSKYFNSENS